MKQWMWRAQKLRRIFYCKLHMAPVYIINCKSLQTLSSLLKHSFPSLPLFFPPVILPHGWYFQQVLKRTWNKGQRTSSHFLNSTLTCLPFLLSQGKEIPAILWWIFRPLNHVSALGDNVPQDRWWKTDKWKFSSGDPPSSIYHPVFTAFCI